MSLVHLGLRWPAASAWAPSAAGRTACSSAPTLSPVPTSGVRLRSLQTQPSAVVREGAAPRTRAPLTVLGVSQGPDVAPWPSVLTLCAGPMGQLHEPGVCHLSSAEHLVLDKGFTHILPCGPIREEQIACQVWKVRLHTHGPVTRRREIITASIPVTLSLRPHTHTSSSTADVALSDVGCVCFFHQRKTQNSFSLLVFQNS